MIARADSTLRFEPREPIRTAVHQIADTDPTIESDAAWARDEYVRKTRRDFRRVEPCELPILPIVGERRSSTGPVAAILIGFVMVVVACIAALGFGTTLGIAALVGFTASLFASGAGKDSR